MTVIQLRKPNSKWVTDEWDRYNGTNSFTNSTNRPIEYTLEVTEGVNESVSANSTGNTWVVFIRGLHSRYGLVEMSEWAVGDKSLDPLQSNLEKRPERTMVSI